MNTRLFALTLAAVMPWPTSAAPPDAVTVMVTCRNGDWPTAREVARYINAKTFEQTDAAYRQMLWEGRRKCRHGASQLQLIFERGDAALQATTEGGRDGS